MEITLPLLVNLVLNGLVLGTLYFLLASGLSLIFGVMSVLNLAHGAFFMWGAYTGLAVLLATNNFWLALLAGAAAGAALGIVAERATIRFLYGKHLQQILLTLGLLLVMGEAVQVIWGPQLHGFPVPAFARGTVFILDYPFARYRALVLAAGAVVLVLVFLLLHRTKLGLIVRAGVENPDMVQALGVNVSRVFTQVFALGAALAALGGVLAGPFFRTVWPQMASDLQLYAFIVVVIGGLGNVAGAAVGSLLVGLGESLMGFFYPEAAMAVNFGLMALVLLVRPWGLFGSEADHQ